VALDVEDLTETDEGLRIWIRRSKTDPEAHGDEVGVVKGQHPDIDPVRALQNWRRLGEITGGPLFRPVTRADTVRRGRLSGQTVALIVQRTAMRAPSWPAPEAFPGIRSAPVRHPRGRGGGAGASDHAPGPLAQLRHRAALHPDRRPLAGERLRLVGTVTGRGSVSGASAAGVRMSPG
jgi:hypothetical protein